MCLVVLLYFTTCLCTLIQILIFRGGTKYMNMPAFCVKTEKFHSGQQEKGIHNVPRQFIPHELAKLGQVSRCPFLLQAANEYSELCCDGSQSSS